MTPDDAKARRAERPDAPPGRRRRAALAVTAAAVVALVAVVVVVVVSSDDPAPFDEPAQAPASSGLVVDVPAGDPIQVAVDANPAGTTFRLGAGVHRGQAVVPRAGDVFEGVGPDTVLDGSVDLTGWQADGSTWSVSGLPAAAPAHGQCRAETPRCDKAEELFRDGVALRAVAALADVGPGTWWFDDATGTAHVGDDPTRATMALSVVPHAFDGEAGDVVVRDMTVTHYATPAQRGAVNAMGPRWLVERVVATENHALGVYFEGDGTVVRDVVAHDNGQMGMGASGSTGALVERVDLAGNNRAGFDDEWEGGGAKFTVTTGLRIVDSVATGNDGTGIWFDESAQDSVIDGNRSIGNTSAGIFYEISKGATITDNVVQGNGFGERSKGWLWGAGIAVAASSDVTIVGNEVSGNMNAITLIQQDRGSGPFGERLVDDVEVRGNWIRLDGGLVGMATDMEGTDLFERSVSFAGNTYEVEPTARAFAWDGDEVDLARWGELGFS